MTTAIFFIGQPMTHSDMKNHREGFVADFSAGHVTVVFPEEDEFTDIPLSIATKWADVATHYPTSPGAVADMMAEARAARMVRLDARAMDHGARQRAGKEFDAKLAELAGDNKGVIVATYCVDDSDSQSDYWGHKTEARVVLGFAKTARNNFKTMRKFAATWSPTEHIAIAPKKAEHRENWSMGGGYYLKDGSRHSTGWEIRIEFIKWNISPAEFHLPGVDTPAPVTTESNSNKMTAVMLP